MHNNGNAEVSASNVLKILVALLFEILISFSVSGYQALLPVLIDEGVYENLCGPNTNTTVHHHHHAKCNAQQLRLDLMFTLTTSITNSFGIVTALLSYNLGPAWTVRIGSALISGGSLLFAFSSKSFDAYIPGYVMMGAGGITMGLPLMMLAMLMPSHAGLLFSILMGGVDASTSVMFLMWLLHNKFGFSTRLMFGANAVIPAALILCTFWLFPSTPKEQENSKKPDDTQPLIQAEEGEKPQPPSNAPQPWFGEQTKIIPILKSFSFITMTIWSAIYMTTKYYFMTNVNEQLLWATHHDEDLTDVGVLVFSICLPLSGFFSPITSMIMSKFGPSSAILLMAAISAIIGVTSSFQIYAIQYFNLIGTVFNRFFFFSSVPFLLARMYGNIGPATMTGCIYFLSACLNYSNYLWSFLAIDVLDHNFRYTNIGLSAACVISGVLFALLVKKWNSNPSVNPL